MKPLARCANCETDRFIIRARGLCKRCYSITRKIEQIEGWNLENEQTLEGYPAHFHLVPHDEMVRMRDDVLMQLKAFLKDMRRAEERLNGPISSIDIEFLLQSLAERARAKDSRRIMHGTAPCFDDFTPKQKSLLFGLLYSIEENIPGRHRILWSRYMNPRPKPRMD